jgi:hypothetical protein
MWQLFRWQISFRWYFGEVIFQCSFTERIKENYRQIAINFDIYIQWTRFNGIDFGHFILVRKNNYNSIETHIFVSFRYFTVRCEIIWNNVKKIFSKIKKLVVFIQINQIYFQKNGHLHFYLINCTYFSYDIL